MNVKPKRIKRIDIADSGALSDLAFLLIIFFIVIAVFHINKGFILELPKRNSKKIVNTNDIIKVTLGPDGSLWMKQERIEIADLESTTREKLINQPNLTFVLRIHPEVAYQKVVDVVAVVQRLDVDNFSFAMHEDNL